MSTAKGAGAVFVVVALIALWAYNTGRLEALLGVIKDPNYVQGKTQNVLGLGVINTGNSGIASTAGSGTGGGTDWASTISGIFSVATLFA